MTNEDSSPRRKSILKKVLETSTESATDASTDSETTNQFVDDDVDLESVHVKFQNVEIRDYAITLADNPGGRGPPVGLGWDYDEAGEVPLEIYEESRGQRRKMYQMHMHSSYRKDLLKRNGVTEDEMDYMVKEMKKIRKGRERTKMMLPFMKLEDAAESAKRKVNRAIS